MPILIDTYWQSIRNLIFLYINYIIFLLKNILYGILIVRIQIYKIWNYKNMTLREEEMNGKLELEALVRIQKIGDGKNVGTN